LDGIGLESLKGWASTFYTQYQLHNLLQSRQKARRRGRIIIGDIRGTNSTEWLSESETIAGKRK